MGLAKPLQPITHKIFFILKNRLFYDITIAVLLFCALMDMILWFTIKFYVPSYVISCFSLCLVIILWGMRRLFLL